MSNSIDAEMANVAASPFAAYFTNREPIDGTLTVAELTASSCRWPTGNPRDLATFRYCGETACGGSYCKRNARLASAPGTA
jgi:hypothetical protein